MKRTSLHAVHERSGAKLIEFGGWHMPVQYGPILDEVRCVRTRAGLFDLGHMGRLHVRGKDALRYVDRLFTNFCAKMGVGQIRYSLLCREDGYPIDDVLLYREEQAVYVVVNASNTAADLEWMRRHQDGLEVVLEDQTEASGMLALQGPAAREVLQPLLAGLDLAQLGYYRFGFATVCGMPHTRVSRTGYTGELGYEIYLPAGEAPRVWSAVLEAGRAAGVLPIGLGARDILRLEAGMPLYGHEIDLSHHPLEAGLAFGVSFDPHKGDWIGRAALERARQAPTRRLVGLTSDGPRVPRQGTPVRWRGEEIGQVCSGAPSPTLNRNIASAYVRLGLDQAGTEVELDFRGKPQPARVCELPFYSRTRK
jgi:aminomethyltransferase